MAPSATGGNAAPRLLLSRLSENEKPTDIPYRNDVTPKSIFSQLERRSRSEVRSEYGSLRTTTPVVPSPDDPGGTAAGAGSCVRRTAMILSARRASCASGAPG